MKYTFTLTIAIAAIAITIPGSIQRPDVVTEVGPITGTDNEVANSDISVPGTVQRPDISVEFGPITGADDEVANSAARGIQPTDARTGSPPSRTRAQLREGAR